MRRDRGPNAVTLESFVCWWEGGKVGEGGKVVRLQSGKGGRVVKWQGGKGVKMVSQEGGRYLVLFQGWGIQDESKISVFCFLC